MHSKNITFILFFFLVTFIFGQEKFTISGTVFDKNSNETLISVSIYFPELNTGTTTNEYGFYSITIPKGNYSVIVSSIGYKSINENIDVFQKIVKNFILSEEVTQLDNIIIESSTEKMNVKSPQMSVNSLKASTIKQIPVVLGEADIIKSLILLPGVTSAGEGASGFNVRGGAVDQNLMLLDEAIVFNSSHLFGFFSVFNPDVIKNIKLYKGGIPAKYGGRLSSVLDIYQKEGNSKEFKISGGSGLISNRLLLEGPIVKEKSSFLIGGRSLIPININDNVVYFYDINSKINFRINKNNNFFLSTYFGKDMFSINNSFVNIYGNSVVNLRWNHLFSDKLFSNLSLIYSDYFYGLTLDFAGFEWDSGITNFNFKYDFKHYISDKVKLNYGINNIYIKFNPGKIAPNRADSGIVGRQLINKFANEFATYIDVEHKINSNFNMRYGVRISNFLRLGQDKLNNYQNNLAVIYNETLKKYESAPPISSETYDRSDVISNFTNFEPRVSFSYSFNEDSSLKASYNRMAQYLHLLSNTSSPTPLDVWTPSGKYIKPQLSDQYSIGYFKTIKDGDYSLETEVFYKDIQNRIDYINGANLIANDQIETVILNGKSRAYGLEVLFKKNFGKWKGWVAYTLSKSEQLTAGRNVNESGINNGEWYNTPYDKTHDLSIIASYKLNKKWKFNANFVLQTGQPTNYPVGQYEFENINIPIYANDKRNSNRLPTYHRFDISATLTPKKNSQRRWKGEWVFGVYNLYGRKNAASIAFARNDETQNNEALKTSIFGIVPSVTYNFKF